MKNFWPHRSDAKGFSIENLARKYREKLSSFSTNKVSNQHLGNSHLKSLNEDTILINTARCAIIKNLDIILDGLKSNKLAAVGLDVLPKEPPQKEDALIKIWIESKSPLCDIIIINPHSAYYSSSSILEMRTKASQNMLNSLIGEKVKNIINLT